MDTTMIIVGVIGIVLGFVLAKMLPRTPGLAGRAEGAFSGGVDKQSWSKQ